MDMNQNVSSKPYNFPKTPSHHPWLTKSTDVGKGHSRIKQTEQQSKLLNVKTDFLL